MVEGQEGVTWEQWVALARACEEAGLEALFRSDHYTGFHGGEGGSLDAWATISALAGVTSTLRLGTLVSPATFRHPSVLARMVVTADHVSNGRVELGFGAGWHEPEHTMFGFPFATAKERVARFAEQLEIVHRQWTEDEFDFAGEFYELRGCRALPKPLAKPNLIVGGSAKPGTAHPAARFADEYNTIFVTPDEAARRRDKIAAACLAVGRPMLTFSLMTQAIVGEDKADVERRRRRIEAQTGRAPEERSGHTLVGTVDEVRARLAEYEDAGVERVMCQHLLHDDLDMVALLAEL
jgi:alkanesulfonate monooxygenase SsuD/methylene tetrahydromethanopterin reductase-like flavin-dependent oxidoreductase (luciferase family)